jgi:hypothetical protein
MLSPVKSSGALADYLYMRMTSIYGHKWTSFAGEDPRGFVGREWSGELLQFKRGEIDDAFESLKKLADEWPPTLIGFKKILLGIPSFNFLKANIGNRISPFVRLAWSIMDAPMRTAFTTQDTKSAERLLQQVYEQCVSLRMQGETFPDPPAALLAAEKKKIKPSTSEFALAQIYACLSQLNARDDDLHTGYPSDGVSDE